MQAFIEQLKWLFTKTLPAGRVMGIPLRIHLLLLIFIGINAIRYLGHPGNPIFNLGFYFFYLLVLWISILLHELGHAWGNRLVNGITDQIMLTPVGGLHIGTGSDASPKTELIVVALGPAVSILLVIIGFILMKGSEAILAAFELPDLLEYYLSLGFSSFFVINLALTIFNLTLPIFPLDVARLIRAGFSIKFNPGLVTLWVTRVGIVFAIFCLIVSFTPLSIMFIPEGGLILGLIAMLGIQACLQEQTRIQFQDVYSKSDRWGGRQVYYDSDIMSYARRTAKADLGPVGFLIPGGSATSSAAPKQKRKGTIKKSERIKAAEKKKKAKVIDISLDRDPAEIDDMKLLEDMMHAAAEQENYKLAAKVKQRIRELKG